MKWALGITLLFLLGTARFAWLCAVDNAAGDETALLWLGLALLFALGTLLGLGATVALS